ncbi:hypothetical protein SAMN04488127_2873 [Bhargavaea ginsengi]|uniref:Uncharacterized protein n=1 Tax=Bhargavaea ginsengi TaxID=426757 RepID=A0A1H7C1L3_9BACL|nr:hypothetical protein SAMN04488127_2873 [Bhargavaea ginsengi]
MNDLRLSFLNVSCLSSTSTLLNVKRHLLTFVQRFEAVTLDCGEVYEYVVSTFTFDKAKTFFCVKPFNCTLFHFCCLLVRYRTLYYYCCPKYDQDEKLIFMLSFTPNKNNSLLSYQGTEKITNYMHYDFSN